MIKIKNDELSEEHFEILLEAISQIHYILNEYDRDNEVELDCPYNFFVDSDDNERCVAINAKILNIGMSIKPALTIVEDK